VTLVSRVGWHVRPRLATSARCRSSRPQVTFLNTGPGKRLGPDPSRDHHERQTPGNHRVPNKTSKPQADHAHDKSWAKPLGRGQILSVELNDSYPS
jgi:hypothetical protein